MLMLTLVFGCYGRYEDVLNLIAPSAVYTRWVSCLFHGPARPGLGSRWWGEYRQA